VLKNLLYLQICHSLISTSAEKSALFTDLPFCYIVHRSLFPLPCCASIGHVVASNCDLCFGHLLNFANLHSIFANPWYYCFGLPSSTYFLLINTVLTLQSRLHSLLVSITN